MAKAYGAMADVFGGPQGFLQYLMIQSGTYEKLAKANGQAISGLQPKITVWNTGKVSHPSESVCCLLTRVPGNGDASQDTTAPIRNLMQSLPPLFSTIHEQTGISPPAWMAQLPQPKQPNSEKPQLPMDLKGKGRLTAPNGA
jgi:flotillin